MSNYETWRLYDFETDFESAVRSLVDELEILPKRPTNPGARESAHVSRAKEDEVTPFIAVMFTAGEDRNQFTDTQWPHRRQKHWNATLSIAITTSRRANKDERQTVTGYDEHARMVAKVRDAMHNWPETLTHERLPRHRILEVRDLGATPRIEREDGQDVTELKFGLVFAIRRFVCVPLAIDAYNAAGLTSAAQDGGQRFDISPAFTRRAIVDQYEDYGYELELGPFPFDYDLVTTTADFVADDLFVINDEVLGARFAAGSIIAQIPVGETCKIRVRDNFAQQIGIESGRGVLLLRCTTEIVQAPTSSSQLTNPGGGYLLYPDLTLPDGVLCHTLQRKVPGEEWKDVKGWEGLTGDAVDQAQRTVFSMSGVAAGTKYRLVAINAAGRGAYSNEITYP